MQQQEDFSSHDLAELFRQKISLSPRINNGGGDALHSVPVEAQEIVLEEEASPINYSISQHYHHSAHIAQAINVDKPPTSHLTGFPQRGLSIYQTLAQHNISPSSLLRSQLTLFEQADDDQRSRLIQLWTISPPNYAANQGQELMERPGGHQIRTLEEEEHLAWLRYQINVYRERHQDENELGSVTHGNRNLLEGEDHYSAETYITSGYELLAQRDYELQWKRFVGANVSPSVGLIFGDQYNHATDPVYERNLQQSGDTRRQSTENHYGMFDQADPLQMQHQHVVTMHEAEDEEML